VPPTGGYRFKRYGRWSGRANLFLDLSIGIDENNTLLLKFLFGIDENNTFQLKLWWAWQTFFGSIDNAWQTFFGSIDRYRRELWASTNVRCVQGYEIQI